MRLLLLLTLFLLPLLGSAQVLSTEYERGTYVLTNSPTVRHEGYLKLDTWQLAVKTYDDQRLRLTPAQVSSIRIDDRRYVTAGNFHVKYGLKGLYVSEAFVQQVDSGRVELLRFDSLAGTPGMVTGAVVLSVYLLRTPGLPPTLLQSQGKKFRDELRPYLAARPDLQQLLNEKRLDLRDLPAAIYALNHSQPFQPR